MKAIYLDHNEIKAQALKKGKRVLSRSSCPVDFIIDSIVLRILNFSLIPILIPTSFLLPEDFSLLSSQLFLPEVLVCEPALALSLKDYLIKIK